VAYKEVKVSDEELKSSNGEFFKFQAIGDKFEGEFVSSATRVNNFGKTEQNYTFKRIPDGKLCTITANKDLNVRLTKAALRPGMKVFIKYVKDIPIPNQTSPMRSFVVGVDDGAAAPPPPPPADDIPF
jgi:hypothetical protein